MSQVTAAWCCSTMGRHQGDGQGGANPLCTADVPDHVQNKPRDQAATASSGAAFVNGRIHPMRGQGEGAPWEEQHEALLVNDGKVLALGPSAAIEAEARRRSWPVQDLDGRLVLPGFVDAHTHFLHIGVKNHRPDLGHCKSKHEALEVLAAWLAAHPGDEPIIGERWDESDWNPRERPTRTELDAVVAAAAQAGHGPANRVVVLRRVCGHIAVANSAALNPIRKRWNDPALVDPETGLVLEQASLYLNEVIPTSDKLLDQALEEATAECHALGLTTVGDYSQAPYRAALQRAAAAGRLRIRVASSIYVQQLQAEMASGMRTGRPHTGFLRDGGLKVFLDGSLGAHTAALRQPYAGGGHEHPNGLLNWSDDEVEGFFRTAAASGLQIHAHAIGDAAIDQGLAAFEAMVRSQGPDRRVAGTPAGSLGAALRHRFEHFEIVHDDQLHRTAHLGIVASSQPNFVGTWSAKGGMYEERLGTRFALNNRFRTMLDMGIRLAFGSDGMPPGPLVGLAAAVHHPDANERLGPLEAAYHYTWWSAWALHWQDEVGSLDAGKRADFVVLDTPQMADPATWKVCQTWLDGQIVHGLPL